jgi:hypothetical protein
MRIWRTDSVLHRGIPLLLGILALTAACTKPGTQTAAVPMVPLDKACVTPAPLHRDLHLTVAQQPVTRYGVWRAYPGWTIPVAIAGSYLATLSIPTADGYSYDSKNFKVKWESGAWHIAPGSEQFLPTPAVVGAPMNYAFVIVPTGVTGRPGIANGTPPSASMIRIALEGVKTPDGQSLSPFVLRIVDKQEIMPACLDTSIPNL